MHKPIEQELKDTRHALNNIINIKLYKQDFTEEAWTIICKEFEADTNGEFILCNADLNSLSQGI